MDQPAAEDPSDWFDPGTQIDVAEEIEFTSENYDFPESASDGIAAMKQAVFPVPFWAIAFGPDDQFPADGECESTADSDLPFEVEGIVTVHPRFYFKTDGCGRGSDEKYYGSYFIQDRTGGVFVLGDSKVAHFDVGDRVRLRVRGAKTSYDLDMVYAHDVIEVERGPFPVYYEEQSGPMSLADVAEVKRITGTVTAEPDTFGQFPVEADDGSATWYVQLDSELSRRGVGFEPGDRIQATGPVLYSYSQFSVVIMRVGQLQQLD